jgi:hypothetical protein
MNRWTENAMTFNTLRKKLKIGEHEPLKKGGVLEWTAATLMSLSGNRTKTHKKPGRTHVFRNGY